MNETSRQPAQETVSATDRSMTHSVRFEHVSKAFGTKQILDDVSWEVPAGQALCILGRSGMGKSVTLKLSIALMRPDAGKIWIEGEDIAHLDGRPLSEVRRKMGFLFQDAALLIPFRFMTTWHCLCTASPKNHGQRWKKL